MTRVASTVSIYRVTVASRNRKLTSFSSDLLYECAEKQHECGSSCDTERLNVVSV